MSTLNSTNSKLDAFASKCFMPIRSGICPVAISAISPRRNCVWPIIKHTHFLALRRQCPTLWDSPCVQLLGIHGAVECALWWTRPVLPRRPQCLHFEGVTTIPIVCATHPCDFSLSVELYYSTDKLLHYSLMEDTI